jgi:hypothetical protein
MSVGNLDVNMALQFMGPADFAEHKPVRFMQLYTQVISNIAMTIMRAMAYVFVQAKWYNNHTARNLVIQYINTVDRVDYSDEVHQRISDIFEELKVRQWGWFSSVSYADGLNELAHAKGIELENAQLDDDELPQVLDFGSLKNRNLYVFRDGVFKSGKIGNSTMLAHTQEIEQTKALLQDYAGVENIPTEALLLDDEVTFRARTFDVTQRFGLIDPATVNEDLLALAPFRYREGYRRDPFPEGFDVNGKPEDGLVADESLSDYVFNSRYSGIKDPMELFSKALVYSFKELDHTDHVRYLPYRSHQDPIASKQWDTVIRCMLTNMLQQAFVNMASCHHEVHFNEYVYCAYQKPQASLDHNGQTQMLFGSDLLSTPLCGVDPEVAYRTLKHIEKTKGLQHLKTITLKDPLARGKLSVEEEIFLQNIDEMTRQFKSRYLESLAETVKKEIASPHADPKMDVERDLTLYKSSFKDFIKEARTPFAVFSMAFDFVAQNLANQGLIAQDDIIGGDAEKYAALISERAIFLILSEAEAIDDFTLKLNEHVNVPFSKMFAFVKNDTNPLIFGCKEIATYNPICDSESDADPIYLASLLSEFKGSKAHMNFLREYLFAEDEVELYKEKKEALIESGTKSLADFGDDSQALNRHAKLNGMFYRLPRDSKKVLEEIKKHVKKEAWSFKDHVFKAKNIAQDIYNDVEFDEDVVPSASNVDVLNPWHAQEKVTKAVDVAYLPHWMQNSITIKNRAIKKAPPEVFKLTQARVNTMGNDYALSHQNTIIHNPSRCGNCGYGALSQEIWENSVNSISIEQYSMGLRQIVSNYIRENIDEFIPKMLKQGEQIDSSGLNYAQRTALNRKGINLIREDMLRQQAITYAADVTNGGSLLWISDLELEVISKIFGVRIDVFDTSQGTPLRSGVSGVVEGVLIPNRVYGAEFTGSPIRVKFTGNHFQVLRMKDR